MQLATSQAGKGDVASRFSIVIQAGSHLINRLITSTARIQVFCKTADYFRCGEVSSKARSVRSKHQPRAASTFFCMHM